MKQIVFCYLFATSIAAKLDNTYLPPPNAGLAGGNQFLSTPFGGNSFKSPGGFQKFGGLTESGGFRRTFQNANFQHAPTRTSYPANTYGPSNTQHGYVPPATGFGGPNNYGTSSYPHTNDNILKYNSRNYGDGTYEFDFETENKISQQEAGRLENAGTDNESNVVKGAYSYVAPNGKTIAVNYVADENGFRASGDHIPVGSAGAGIQHDLFGQKYDGQSYGNARYILPGTGPQQQDYQNRHFNNEIKSFPNQNGLNQVARGNGFSPFSRQNDVETSGRRSGLLPLGIQNSFPAFNRGGSFNQPLGSLRGGIGTSRKYLPPDNTAGY